MTTLLLRLAGPMQAWGDSSRFTRRDTRMTPSKSGVLGLLAAADGRRRTDPIEDLAELRFGVRVDQPGSLQRDFQTAINWDTGDSMPLSYRYYVADAVFVAAIEGPHELLTVLGERVRSPRFPLYLGRRSCPVSGQVYLGVTDKSLEVALREHEWEASAWYRRSQPKSVELELFMDADGRAGVPLETRRDVPLSYDPTRREYGWREVAHLPYEEKSNPDGWRPSVGAGTDWFATVEET